MVSTREPLRSWLYRVFGKDSIQKMDKMAEQHGEELFNSGYTVEDYEGDLEYHERQMKRAEQKFEHFDDIRTDYLKDAMDASSLTRKRLLAKAKLYRKKAYKYVKLFAAHLQKFETKLDDLTAYEIRMVDADEDANVDLDEAAKGIREGLVESELKDESLAREEADKAVERELGKHSLDDLVEAEEEALRKMEEEGLSADEVGLDEGLDEFLSEELGGEEGSEEDEFDDDQVDLDW